MLAPHCVNWQLLPRCQQTSARQEIETDDGGNSDTEMRVSICVVSTRTNRDNYAHPASIYYSRPFTSIPSNLCRLNLPASSGPLVSAVNRTNLNVRESHRSVATLGDHVVRDAAVR